MRPVIPPNVPVSVRQEPAAPSPTREPAGNPPLALRIKGKVRVGRRCQSRRQHEILENPDLRDLLMREVAPDTVVEAVDRDTELAIVDCDVHHLKDKPSHEQIATHESAIDPAPDAWWVSHGGGLKLVYVGPDHRKRALVAAFCIPQLFTIELLTRTRHPQATSLQHGDARCGPVHFGVADPSIPFVWRGIGRATEDHRCEALESLDMQDGGRYNHARCPLDPGADSSATDCVTVVDHGVYCHRCAARGIRYRDDLAPGFMPWSAVVRGDQDVSVFGRLAATPVHWTHAQHELRHLFPRLGIDLLQEAYRLALDAHAYHPLLIAATFNPALDFLYTTNGWVSSCTCEPTEVDADAANGLPYVMRIQPAEPGGEPTVKYDSVRRSQARHRAIPSYSPLRVYRGVDFRPQDSKTIPIKAPSNLKHAVALLSDPIPLDEAFCYLELAFPSLSRMYLRAILSALICAAAVQQQPPMLWCSGPSGSGKGETIRLGQSFVDDSQIIASLEEDSESFARLIGHAQAAGHTGITIDEFGKTPKIRNKIPGLLKLNAQLTWRPLFKKFQTSPLHAAFFIPCVSFPAVLVNSPEISRRVLGCRLSRKVPNWARTSGGDTAAWRDRCADNARVANSILTHVWRHCHSNQFDFFKMAEVLGLQPLDEGESHVSDELLRELYCVAHGDRGTVQTLDDNKSFGKGYLSITDPLIRPLVEAMIPMDDPDTIRYARQNLENVLTSKSWNDILRIGCPDIRCRVHIHGQHCGLKFEEDRPGLRGSQRVNSALPAIPAVAGPSDNAFSAAADPIPSNPSKSPPALPPHTAIPDVVQAAAAVLQKAGMP